MDIKRSPIWDVHTSDTNRGRHTGGRLTAVLQLPLGCNTRPGGHWPGPRWIGTQQARHSSGGSWGGDFRGGPWVRTGCRMTGCRTTQNKQSCACKCSQLQPLAPGPKLGRGRMGRGVGGERGWGGWSATLQTWEVLPDSHLKLGIFPVGQMLAKTQGRTLLPGHMHCPGKPRNKRLLNKAAGAALRCAPRGCRLGLGSRSCPCCMACAGKPHQ